MPRLFIIAADSIDSDGKPTTSSTIELPRIFRFEDESDLSSLNEGKWLRNGPWNDSQYATGMQAGAEFDAWFLQNYHRSNGEYYVFNLWIAGNFSFDGISYIDGIATHDIGVINGGSKAIASWLPINHFQVHIFARTDSSSDEGYAVFVNDELVANEGDASRREIEPIGSVTVHKASAPFMDWGNGEGCETAFLWRWFNCGATQMRFVVDTENEGSFETTVDISASQLLRFPFLYSFDELIADVTGSDLWRNQISVEISNSAMVVRSRDTNLAVSGDRELIWITRTALADWFDNLPANRFDIQESTRSQYPYGNLGVSRWGGQATNVFTDHPVWGDVAITIEMICPEGSGTGTDPIDPNSMTSSMSMPNPSSGFPDP